MKKSCREASESAYLSRKYNILNLCFQTILFDSLTAKFIGHNSNIRVEPYLNTKYIQPVINKLQFNINISNQRLKIYNKACIYYYNKLMRTVIHKLLQRKYYKQMLLYKYSQIKLISKLQLQSRVVSYWTYTYLKHRAGALFLIESINRYSHPPLEGYSDDYTSLLTSDKGDNNDDLSLRIPPDFIHIFIHLQECISKQSRESTLESYNKSNIHIKYIIQYIRWRHTSLYPNTPYPTSLTTTYTTADTNTHNTNAHTNMYTYKHNSKSIFDASIPLLSQSTSYNTPSDHLQSIPVPSSKIQVSWLSRNLINEFKAFPDQLDELFFPITTTSNTSSSSTNQHPLTAAPTAPTTNTDDNNISDNNTLPSSIAPLHSTSAFTRIIHNKYQHNNNSLKGHIIRLIYNIHPTSTRLSLLTQQQGEEERVRIMRDGLLREAQVMKEKVSILFIMQTLVLRMNTTVYMYVYTVYATS